MKVVILAGGLGTRLEEETQSTPKPMVEIGRRPILWHIMKLYAHFGYKEFIIALGYKQEVVKDYFRFFVQRESDLIIDLSDGSISSHGARQDDWTVSLVDTGIETQTGGRLKRLRDWIGKETFMMTYGDGVSDIDLKDLLAFHRSHGKLVTATAVRPPARFGALTLDGDTVVRFGSTSQVARGWINGGFFVIEPAALDRIEGDRIHWEGEPLKQLAAEGQLAAFKHTSFWQCMDTLREKRLLEALWESGDSPWALWR